MTGYEQECRRGLEPVLDGITKRFGGPFSFSELTDGELAALRTLLARRMATPMMDNEKYRDAAVLTWRAVNNEYTKRSGNE